MVAALAAALHGVVFIRPEPAASGNVIRVYPYGGHVLLFDAAAALFHALFPDASLYRLRWGAQPAGWTALYAELRYPADAASLHGHIYLDGNTLLVCVRVHECALYDPNPPWIGPVVQLV